MLEVALVADSKVVADVIGDLQNPFPPKVGSLDVLDIIHIVVGLGTFLGSLFKLLEQKLTSFGKVGNGLRDIVDKKVSLGGTHRGDIF